MADWCMLPAELLHSIRNRLPTSIDLLRFRSVCATWRAAAPPPPASPTRFPLFPNAGIFDTSWGFCLSRRTIYSLQSPSNSSLSPWIIKLERDDSHRMKLLDPLAGSSFPLVPLPASFPKTFSFLDIRIRELGEEYTLRYINFRLMANSVGESGSLYSEKVAVLDCMNGGGFVLVTIHISGKLVVYRTGEHEWKVIEDSSAPYDDVILRLGKFYAVDHTGRTLVFDGVDLNASVVADSICGGDKKYLVDWEGEVVLVDKYLTGGMIEEADCLMGERTLHFEVWRLDENEGKWVEMSDFGNGVVFIGDNCTFSASSEECCRKNCIFFRDPYSSKEEEAMGVFDMESGVIESIGSQEMFWPPPDWISSAASPTRPG